MHKILVVDGNNVAWANQYTLKFATNARGESTGAFFGTLRTIQSAITKLKPTQVFIAWDSWTWRKDVNSSYKALRSPGSETGKAVSSQIANLWKILENLNVRNCMAHGYEADDVAKYICDENQDQQIILLSADRDWFQLIQKHVSLWDYKNKKLLTEENFAEETGWATPRIFFLASCLIGDPSDNISGIKGIGPKTAYAHFHGEHKQKVEKALFSKEFQDILTLRELHPNNVPKDAQPFDPHFYRGHFDGPAVMQMLSEMSCKSLMSSKFLDSFKSLVP